MKRVPKKNISSRISDIQSKDSASEHHEETHAPVRMPETFSIQEPVFPDERRNGRISRSVFFIAAVILLGATVALGANFYVSRERALHASLEEWRELAGQFGEDIPSLSGGQSGAFSLSPGAFFQKISFLFKNIGATYGIAQSASGHLVALAEEFETLEAEWPALFFKEDEGALLRHAERIHESVGALAAIGSEFSAFASVFPEEMAGAFDTYLSFQVELGRVKQFLANALPWLTPGEERRIVLFLNNPSELRPGGGFLGSYVDVTMRGGSVVSMDVHDINDADREFEETIVPPKQLQGIVRRWRAADANWFFDFSASAEKTLRFLEASNFYKNNGVRFDGAIGITPAAIADIIERTGPFSLAGGEITHENFLFEIQKEVQGGLSSGVSNPKRILAELTPLLVGRLTEIPREARAELLSRAREWIADKDVMVYFRESAFQNFFSNYHATGDLMDLPYDWNGDYFAVVNANIGGGKTDLFVDQRVQFESQIEADGTANNRTTVTRTHNGSKNTAWWYRVTNTNFLQIVTPPSVQLTGVTGGLEKRITPRVPYAKEGYTVDPDLAEIEKSERQYTNYPAVVGYAQDKKSVFSTWTETALGKTSKVIIEYRHRLFAPPSEGGTYQFVFEKQSGSRGEYSFEIHAPVGFRFRENGLPVFEYTTSDPPGRMAFDLTFEKNPD